MCSVYPDLLEESDLFEINYPNSCLTSQLHKDIEKGNMLRLSLLLIIKLLNCTKV